jgi:membrane protein DedA with SNARE-associated domain
MQIIQTLAHFLLSLFNAHEFPVLAALLFIEADGVFLPVPGDTFIALAASQHPPSPAYSLAVLGLAILSANLGALVLFSLMHHGGRTFVERYGKFFFLNSRRIARLESWYQRHGNVAITLGWVIPGTRILTAVMAGLANVGYRSYLIAAFFGSILWATICYGIGVLIYFEGPTFGTTLSHLLGNAFIIAVVAVIAGAIAFNVWHSNRNRRRFSLADLTFLNPIKRGVQAVEKGARAVEKGVVQGAHSVEKGVVNEAHTLQKQVQDQAHTVAEHLRRQNDRP